MTCKMTLFFNQYAAGFSETFFHPSTDPTLLQVAVANSLYQAAAKFRHVSVILKAARFSRVESPKLSVLWVPYPRAQGTRYTESEPGPDAVSTTAVFQLSSQTGQKRRIWCRGLADVDITRDAFGNDILSPSLLKMTNEYFQELFTAGFSIRYGQRPPEAGLTWKPVSSVFLDGAQNLSRDRVTINVNENAASYAVGDLVQFAGLPPGLPRFPRINQIISFKPNNLGITQYVIAYNLPNGIGVSPAKMKVCKAQFTTSTITRWVFERYGEHKTGRPFGSLRGRQRGIALAR